MQHVIETLEGWVPSTFSATALRWMPPELAEAARVRAGEEALAAAVEAGDVAPEPVEVR